MSHWWNEDQIVVFKRKKMKIKLMTHHVSKFQKWEGAAIRGNMVRPPVIKLKSNKKFKLRNWPNGCVNFRNVTATLNDIFQVAICTLRTCKRKCACCKWHWKDVYLVHTRKFNQLKRVNRLNKWRTFQFSLGCYNMLITESKRSFLSV